MPTVPDDGDQLGVLEAIHSTPARRYLSPEPIPDDILWAILDAAIRGPSGGNAQAWGWMVITDKALMAPIARWYRENWQRAYGSRRDAILSAADAGRGALSRRAYLGAEHLANHVEEAPVWIIPVLREAANSTNPRIGSSIYGAVQNLCLAARAHGIGASLTTLYGGHEDELRELLGLPDDALTMALIPLGYPAAGRWAQPKRAPIEQVTHWNRWGAARSRASQQ